ncbi:hypothetical protein D4764_04G0001770 [Takifugu flavidus]|uniref:Uncharacterized protein n=1 Tax=Takifugu flavidus TaxID=433684 RepID=A0A5C6N6V2_9TELE|nr:hypothetical protein D4764_04G0001770 [Takifugu flavidus]
MHSLVFRGGSSHTPALPPGTHRSSSSLVPVQAPPDPTSAPVNTTTLNLGPVGRRRDTRPPPMNMNDPAKPQIKYGGPEVPVAHLEGT